MYSRTLSLFHEAREALDRCMKDGGWVFLQNIHLMSGWVKALERKLEGSQDPDTHKDFRCFLREPL